MKIRALLAGSVMAAMLAPAVVAEIPAGTIRSFNDALQSGDQVAVIQSSEALISSALENPNDPAARGAAFEAGTQLCLRAACGRANRAAPLMVGPGDPDLSPALANLLVAFAKWSDDQGGGNSASLESALEAVAPESPTLLTILAFDQYYASRVKAGKLADIREFAEMAAAHYAPVKNLIPVNWGRVELSAAATAFADKRDDAVIDRLAKLEVELYPFTLGHREDDSAVKDIYFQTSAWRLAVSSWFKTREQRERSALRVADAFVETERKRLGDLHYADGERPPSYCTGRIVKAPELEYPKTAQAGYIGAVLAGFEINDDKIENIRILASVPDNQFEASVLEAMKAVQWEFDDFQPDPECSRSHKNVVYPFQFYFSSPGDLRSRVSK